MLTPGPIRKARECPPEDDPKLVGKAHNMARLWIELVSPKEAKVMAYVVTLPGVNMPLLHGTTMAREQLDILVSCPKIFFWKRFWIKKQRVVGESTVFPFGREVCHKSEGRIKVLFSDAPDYTAFQYTYPKERDLIGSKNIKTNEGVV